jgi:hypothetical protein
MHLAIKERQVASKYQAIHDRHIAIAHLRIKERKIASHLFSKREHQVTSNHLASMVMFAHLAINVHQITSVFFSERECQVTKAICYVCIWVILIHNEFNLLAHPQFLCM